MKFFKNNLKVIIAFIIGITLSGGIVYAAVSASQVTYTTDKNSTIKSVEDALNDLYRNKKEISDFDFTELLKSYTIVASQGTTSKRSSISTSYTAEEKGIAIAISFAYSAYGTTYTNTSITSNGTLIQQELTGVADRNRYSFAVYKLSNGESISVTGAGTNGEINYNSACGIILFRPTDT